MKNAVVLMIVERTDFCVSQIPILFDCISRNRNDKTMILVRYMIQFEVFPQLPSKYFIRIFVLMAIKKASQSSSHCNRIQL